MTTVFQERALRKERLRLSLAPDPTFGQYAKNPEVLRKAFTHVSDLLMAELVKDMKQ
ncbi:hypothetical protein K7459_12500 [Pseudomonas fluorescens]|uniref:hypothetical protein n=1 Tax=Pseudomonas fluorescens TaxID=294 RepID=UPI0015EB6C44|nr:hypothetical protein [Pseudomonas fluorescens]MBY9024486.1 hypothetical protein [Pseudomonas fluorescens]MBY9030999.1 hypothetical protein [Pseudomonas fluorescens]MBY9037002.1 hypothetical protein [Pseudomonas fluorescens]MBY9043108.1 hypothetical protein [Pseudomonas fluorescens]MBY9048528.1 hypothetical protein [Pseudomonas fluorescens]